MATAEEELVLGNGQGLAKSKAKPFVLGVDLDDVCADFKAGLKVIAADYLDRPPEELIDQTSRDYPEWGVKGEREFLALYRYAAVRRDLLRDIPPIKGASLALRRLRSLHDIRIRIVTDRLFFLHFYRHAVSQTIEWLDQHAFPYDDLCLIEDKTAVQADLYIEDRASNVEDLRDQGRDVIAFMTSTNGHLAGPRANTWKEVEELVTDFVVAWKKRNGSS